MSEMKTIARSLLGVVILLIIAMWVYALFFATKESVNKFGDRQWAERAQERCLISQQERKALADYRIVDDLGQSALAERAMIVDRATDTMQRFVEEFRAELPTDPKGRALVTLWLDDYEVYISDRRDFANDLRSGIDLGFAETPVDGLPISEKIATFAADNEMPGCKPPIDLSI